MGFWVAYADNAGARISGSEFELMPRPVDVDYPTDPLGTVQETADQRVIQQQPNRDGRRRSWIWRGFPADQIGFADQWAQLEGLRSRYRKIFGAATPYVYLKEDVSGELRTFVTYSGVATSATSTTLTKTGAGWPVPLATGSRIEIVSGTGAGQSRPILNNTSSQVTVPAWTVTPDATSSYAIYGWAYGWVRVRVLGTPRVIRSGGGPVRYDEARLTFVIDDPTWNYLG